MCVIILVFPKAFDAVNKRPKCFVSQAIDRLTEMIYKNEEEKEPRGNRPIFSDVVKHSENPSERSRQSSIHKPHDCESNSDLKAIHDNIEMWQNSLKPEQERKL